jgi:hypothetical protein
MAKSKIPVLGQLQLSEEQWTTKSNKHAAAIRSRQTLKQAIKAQMLLVKGQQEYGAVRADSNEHSGPVPWFWLNEDEGEYRTVIRYGTSPIHFDRRRGLSTIRCGPDLESVISVYERIIKAADAGELDEELDRIARSRGRGRNKPHSNSAT